MNFLRKCIIHYSQTLGIHYKTYVYLTLKTEKMLRYSLITWAVIHVSEEHIASIFRVEIIHTLKTDIHIFF